MRYFVFFFMGFVFTYHAFGVESRCAEHSWKVVGEIDGFVPRDGALLLSFKNDLYLFGGWNPGYKPSTFNEVWKSTTNGKSWVKFPNAPWEERHSSVGFVYKEKMWIMGGDALAGHYQNDVWSTNDGVNWTLEDEDPPFMKGGRTLFQGWVKGEKVYVLGGQKIDFMIHPSIRLGSYSDDIFTDVWETSDGKDWKLLTTDHTMGARSSTIGSAVLDDHLVVLGGGLYDTIGRRRFYKNDVWFSKNGIDWSLQLEEAPWKSRMYHNVQSYDGHIFLFSGVDRANLSDTWCSNDGLNWEEIPNGVWSSRHAVSSVVHNDKIIMLGGALDDNKVYELSK